ncbi:MAG: DUF1080 domain-containing protein [Acidobacteriota bacterium]
MQRIFFSPLVVLALLLGPVASASNQTKPNTLSAKELADGWILLWDGETQFGWESLGQAEWSVKDGVLTATSGDSGWLATNATFADFILRIEFRTGADGNSGIFLRSSKEGQPAETGYELQIFNAHPDYPTGSLVGCLKAKPVKPAPDQWHAYEVSAQGSHFVVKLDGKVVLDGRDDQHAVGHIGLQYNKGKKVEFRNIRLKPLGLTSIFNGKDLSGWQRVEAEKAKVPPQWSVHQGMIHVVQGPGQIETERTFQDFVFQLDIRTNPKDANHHPNSGVFFRGDKGRFWSGYESQIRNEFKDGDRSQPIDWGTGAIYNRQATRKVIPNDGEFFTKTIIASGRHMAVWVNGIQVSDFTDSRPEGSNAREQARLAGGTISLQAHDPTTNLDFRNLRIVELPKR